MDTVVIGIRLSYRFIGPGPDDETAMPIQRLFSTEHFPSPLTAEMPCGETLTYETPDDVSLKDVPCPCGDPNHWLVKWINQEEFWTR